MSNNVDSYKRPDGNLKTRVNVHGLHIPNKLPLKSSTWQLTGFAPTASNSVVKSLQAEYYADPSGEYLYLIYIDSMESQPIQITSSIQRVSRHLNMC